jgi:hypothetical protein
MDMATVMERPCAVMGTTATPLTRVRLTATTGLAGFPAECLSAPDRGIADTGVGVVGVRAGAAVGVVVVGADAGSSAAVALLGDADLRAVRLADFMAARFTVAAAGSMAAAVDSTVAVAVMVVADTGNPSRIATL